MEDEAHNFCGCRFCGLVKANLGLWATIGLDGKITDIHEGVHKFVGISSKELIGTDFSKYFTEPQKALQGFQQVLANGSVTDYPLTVRHKDGSLTDVLYNAALYKDEQGQVLGVFAFGRDVTELKRTMREFIETKNFLDNILQSSIKYSIIATDLNFNILSWNEGAKRNYGYTPDEIIGKNAYVLCAPDDVKDGCCKKLLEGALEKGLMEDELERVRKDGSHFTARVVVTRRLDPSGQPIGFLVMSHDISEKAHATEQLGKASLYARSLIEASLDPLVTISPAGKITDVNEASVRVTGVPRDHLIGTDFSDYFTEPDKARQGYEQVFAKGAVTNYPLTIRHRNGSLTDVLYNASLYKDVQGRVLGVFAAARDVAESKRLMHDFIEMKNFLDNILQSAIKYSIIATDLDFNILSWNEGAKRNYGYAAEEIIGKNASVLFTPEDVRNGADKKLLKLALEKGLSEGSFKRVRKNGTYFTASVVVTRRLDASGKPIGFLSMSHDVSEEERVSEQLLQASQYARNLIESSLDPLVTISGDGKITDVNEASVKVTGMPRDQLIGTDFSDYFTEPEKAREGYQQVFAKGSVADYPLTIRHKNGHLTNVLYNASVYHDAQGRVVGVFAAARDITAQKIAEEELGEQRRKELQRLTELEKFQKVTVGRELRMVELKNEIEELKKEIETLRQKSG